MLGGPSLHCQREIFALIISPSLSFSQHTSAQKTVDELGFDQGKGYERIHEANTVLAGFNEQYHRYR